MAVKKELGYPKNETAQTPKQPVRWELTEEDKQFLRSCNISPD